MTLTPTGFDVVPGIPTLDNFTDPDYFNAAYGEYTVNATGPLATTGSSSGLLSCPQIGYSDLQPPTSIPGHLSPGLAAQYKLLSKDFQTEAVTQELTVDGGMSPQYANDTTKLFTTSLAGNFFILLGVLEHPCSRGSTHIQLADQNVYPSIDPRYLSHPFDLAVQYSRKSHSTSKSLPKHRLCQHLSSIMGRVINQGTTY